VHKDPQTVHLPGAEPLHADALQKFRSVTAPLVADLSPPAVAPVADAATGPATHIAEAGRLAGRARSASKTSVN